MSADPDALNAAMHRLRRRMDLANDFSARIDAALICRELEARLTEEPAPIPPPAPEPCPICARNRAQADARQQRFLKRKREAALKQPHNKGVSSHAQA